jgi:uncharacterized protein YutE (UPF0331/DUF86 family)
VQQRHPTSSRLLAIERNILKYRALEMVMILFHVENLKAFVLDAIRTTDEIRNNIKPRIPKGRRNIYSKAWEILVSDGILTDTEKSEIEGLIDYRNDVAHRIHELTYDLNPMPFVACLSG